MPTIEIRRFEDSLVIHFGTEVSRINAYTLASTLVGIADAAKAANAAINPGHEIEIVVEALESGSFKTTIRAVYRGTGNLFSAADVKNIVLGVIASVIFQYTLAPSQSITVNVTSTEVVVEHGDTRVVVPRHVYDAAKEAERIQRFRKGITDVVRSVTRDQGIETIGLSPSQTDPPVIHISKERLALLGREFSDTDTDPDLRDVEESTELQIVRAILEKSRRRWEFVWNGVRVSAPLLDDHFYEEFAAHRITIAPGDILRARLRLKQRRDPVLGIFVNEAYEVVQVIEHRSRLTQSTIDDQRDAK